MGYKVLNDFKEKYHDNAFYRKGDVYPHNGYKADSNRVEYLQEVHPKYGVPFLEKTTERKSVNKKTPPKRNAKSGDK